MIYLQDEVNVLHRRCIAAIRPAHGPFQRPFRTLSTPFVVQSLSSCCPVVVQSLTGQQLDNNWTTTGHQCWSLLSIEKQQVIYIVDTNIQSSVNQQGTQKVSFRSIFNPIRALGFLSALGLFQADWPHRHLRRSGLRRDGDAANLPKECGYCSLMCFLPFWM